MDLKTVGEIIKMMENSKLSSLELEWSGIRIKMEKNSAQLGDILSNTSVTTEAIKEIQVKNEENLIDIVNKDEVEDKNIVVIKAPMVGTFYSAASPTEEPFVKVGDSVKKGDVLCIIEAMKLMNEIECDADGTVFEVMVKSGDMVEYGMPLFKIKK